MSDKSRDEIQKLCATLAQQACVLREAALDEEIETRVIGEMLEYVERKVQQIREKCR